jgi:hypothetical protein
MTYTSENEVLRVQDKRLEKWKVTKDHKDMFITVNYKSAHRGHGQCSVRDVLMIKPNLGNVTIGYGVNHKIKKYKLCCTKHCKNFAYKIQTLYQIHNIQLII